MVYDSCLKSIAFSRSHNFCYSKQSNSLKKRSSLSLGDVFLKASYLHLTELKRTKLPFRITDKWPQCKRTLASTCYAFTSLKFFQFCLHLCRLCLMIQRCTWKLPSVQVFDTVIQLFLSGYMFLFIHLPTQSQTIKPSIIFFCTVALTIMFGKKPSPNHRAALTYSSVFLSAYLKYAY